MADITGFILTEEGDVTPGESSKKYAYDYDDYDNGKTAGTLLEEILEDPEFPNLSEIIVGSWGGSWEESVQELIDGIVENPEKFSHIKSIFFGDMDFEECEVSWIIQGNYSKLWAAMPQLEKFGLRGSSDLTLGKLDHENLREFDIVCGGLPKDSLETLRDAKLPSLERMTLYIGIENYGFDGSIEDIKALLEQSDFPKLRHLGLEDSEIQDEITEVVFRSKYIGQVESLSLANGTLTDKGGQIVLDNLKKYPNIKNLDLHHNYFSDEMVGKLEALAGECGVTIDVSETDSPEEYDGELWYYAMLTE